MSMATMHAYRVRRCADNVEVKCPVPDDRMKPYHDPEIMPTNHADIPDNDNRDDDNADNDNDAGNDSDNDNYETAFEGDDDDIGDRDGTYTIERTLKHKLNRIKWQEYSHKENT